MADKIFESQPNSIKFGTQGLTNLRFVFSDPENPHIPNLTYFGSYALSIMHFFRKKPFFNNI